MNSYISYFFLVFSSTRNNKVQSHVDKYPYSKKITLANSKNSQENAIEIDCLKDHVILTRNIKMFKNVLD